MKNRHVIPAALLAAMSVTLWVSCKKHNMAAPIPEKDLFVSLSGTGNLNNTQQLLLSGADTVIHMGLDLTKPAKMDIQAGIIADTALVTPYNARYQTSYRLLPAINYSLASSSGLSVKSGSDHTIDSAVLTLKGLTSLRSRNYLLPITIDSISGDADAHLDDSTKTVYLNIVLGAVTQTTASLANGGGANDQYNMTQLQYNFGASGAPSPLSFSPVLNIPSPFTITAGMTIDNALVANFDTVHAISGVPFPDGSYTLSAANLSIAAGQTSAATPFTVSIGDLSKFDNTKTYVMPVVLQTISGDPDVDLVSNVYYVELTFNDIDNNNQTPTGNLIDRTTPAAWTATTTSTLDGSPWSVDLRASHLLDNDYSTDWASNAFSIPNALPQSITIDMGTNYPLKTIAYGKPYSINNALGADFSPVTIAVFTSLDNANWSSLGVFNAAPDPNPASSSAAPFISYIRFLSSVNARYFKLTITNSNYNYFSGASGCGMSEINAYQ